MRVEFEQDAISDVQRAVEYYRREGGDELGEQFRDAVLSVLDMVAENARIGAQTELAHLSDVRSFPLDTFPSVSSTPWAMT